MQAVLLRIHGFNVFVQDLIADPGPQALTIYPGPLAECSLSIGYRGGVTNVLFGARHLMVIAYLHSDLSNQFCLWLKEASLLRGESCVYLWI